MLRTLVTLFLGAVLMAPANAQSQTDRSWIATSNNYTQQLLTVEMKHHPEQGSRQGLSEYDEQVSRPEPA